MPIEEVKSDNDLLDWDTINPFRNTFDTGNFNEIIDKKNKRISKKSLPQKSHRKSFRPQNSPPIVNFKSKGGFYTSPSLLYLRDLPEFSVNTCFIIRQYLIPLADISNNRTTWTKKANFEEATFEKTAA